ncbi:MAG: hypothetical protein AAFP68_09750, partial [Pseudomonadota bacterium]
IFEDLDMERRSKRTKTVPKVTPNRQTLWNGYIAFAANETTQTTGGGNDTSATLLIGSIRYGGSSTSVCHAEMDALNDILIGNGDDLQAVIAHADKKVECEAKPCCYRCSVVLGLLGFAPFDEKTLKTAKGMGQTQWVLPSPLKEELGKIYGDIANFLSNFSNATKL